MNVCGICGSFVNPNIVHYCNAASASCCKECGSWYIGFCYNCASIKRTVNDTEALRAELTKADTRIKFLETKLQQADAIQEALKAKLVETDIIVESISSQAQLAKKVASIQAQQLTRFRNRATLYRQLLAEHPSLIVWRLVLLSALAYFALLTYRIYF